MALHNKVMHPAQYQLGLIYDFASAVKFRFDPDGVEVNES